MAKRGGRGRVIADNNSVSDDDKAEFFKVFLPDENSHEIMIPTDYMTYFSRTIGERVTLKDADGKIWHVTVEKTQDGVFLKNGWQRFVNHHLLSYGEFLVFKYEKNYSFLVKIYGINACKKGNFAANDDMTTHVKVEENATEENDTEEEMNYKQALGKRARRLHKETDISFDSSGCPFFVSPPCRPKQYHLKIPRLLVKRQNLHAESEMVLRDAKGKEWDVRITTCKDGRGYIGRGWFRFRIDNGMRPKDRCKFTFGAEKSSRVIRVQILRNVSRKKLRR